MHARDVRLAFSSIGHVGFALIGLAAASEAGVRGLLIYAAIYLFIAGSYTPFTLVTLRGAWGWSLFGLVWGLAAVAADLATEEGCGVIAGTCAAKDIAPDLLINNAGIGMGGRIDHVPRERWETMMQLNLLAPMRLTNLFLPSMIERGSGHIVNISSLAGWVGSEGLSGYCASKFGLRGFGESLFADVGHLGVVGLAGHDQLAVERAELLRVAVIERFGFVEFRVAHP